MTKGFYFSLELLLLPPMLLGGLVNFILCGGSRYPQPAPNWWFWWRRLQHLAWNKKREDGGARED